MPSDGSPDTPPPMAPQIWTFATAALRVFWSVCRWFVQTAAELLTHHFFKMLFLAFAFAVIFGLIGDTFGIPDLLVRPSAVPIPDTLPVTESTWTAFALVYFPFLVFIFVRRWEAEYALGSKRIQEDLETRLLLQDVGRAKFDGSRPALEVLISIYGVYPYKRPGVTSLIAIVLYAIVNTDAVFQWEHDTSPWYAAKIQWDFAFGLLLGFLVTGVINMASLILGRLLERPLDSAFFQRIANVSHHLHVQVPPVPEMENLNEAKAARAAKLYRRDINIQAIIVTFLYLFATGWHGIDFSNFYIYVLLVVVFVLTCWFMALRPLIRIGILALGATLYLGGYDKKFQRKYSFPNIQTADLSGPNARRDLVALEIDRVKCISSPPPPPQKDCLYKYSQPEDRNAVDPVRALNRWRDGVMKRRAERGQPQIDPKLVIVSTSGGAYPAAYWTAMLLDHMTETAKKPALAGLDEHVVLLTGASGGMVGASYYAAMHENGAKPTDSVFSRLDRDVICRKYIDPNVQSHDIDEQLLQFCFFGAELPRGYPRDSLTPVARMFLHNDLFNVWSTESTDTDRGRQLEASWPTLNVRMSDLARGETEGWRPSLIISPVEAESLRPILITNLDLDNNSIRRAGEAARFAQMLPASDNELKLSTAVRMNASFPYVTPLVALPTVQLRRVTDAGYFDNYGIFSAAHYLSDVRVKNWIRKNTSGVILLEFRAFPAKVVGEYACPAPLPVNEDEVAEIEAADADSPEEKIAGLQPAYNPDTREVRGMSAMRLSAYERIEKIIDAAKEKSEGFFSGQALSPIVAAFEARSAMMTLRNSKILHFLREQYDDFPINSLVYVNHQPVSLSWYLSDEDIEAMRPCADYQWTNNYQALLNLWNRRAPERYSQ